MFFISKICSADQNVNFTWPTCISYNSVYGWYIELNFNTYGCVPSGGTNYVQFWAYYTPPGGTMITYGPIDPVGGTSSSKIFSLPTALNLPIQNGEYIRISYNWRCATPSNPGGTSPSDIIDPRDLTSDPVYFNTYMSWLFKACPEKELCAGDFEYCYNTDNMNSPLGQYSYQFNDIDYSQAYADVNDAFNNTVCTLGSKYMVITDKWDFGDGSPVVTSRQIFASVDPNSTFTSPPVFHTFTSNSSGNQAFYSVCHTKKISIVCGYLPDTKPLPQTELPFIIYDEQIIKKCQACVDLCMFQENPPILDDFPTTFVFDIDGTSGAAISGDLLIDSCIGDFQHCAYTEDASIHKFTDFAYDYLLPAVLSEIPNSCGSIIYGGQVYNYTPGFVIFDEWMLDNGPSLSIYKTNSLVNPNLYINGLSSEPISLMYNDNLQHQVCHMKRVEIGCLLQPLFTKDWVLDPLISPPFISHKTILQCSVCSEFCNNEASHNENPQIEWRKESTEKSVLAEDDFVIYPNPATNQLNIEFKSNKGEIITLSLKDLNGRNILNSTKSTNDGLNIISLGISDIASGIYIFEFKSSSKTIVKKVNISN